MERQKLTIEIAAWLNKAVPRLASVSETPQLDAQVLISHIIKQPRTWVVNHPEYQLNISETHSINSVFEKRLNGEPLPYILGHWEFFCLDFFVNPSVLIPRPETELLVEEALSWLKSNPERRLAADVGTGSGCVAISLAQNITNLRLVATDISFPAILLAIRNRARYFLSRRMHLVQANLLDPFSLKFDLICTNPPYIPSHTLKSLDVSRYEPILALDGGEEGLDIISSLFESLPFHLAPMGLFLMEIEINQGKAVQQIAKNVFPFAKIEIKNDLSGKSRLLRLELQ